MSLGEILISNIVGWRKGLFAERGFFRLREAVRGRRGVVSHHGAPGGGWGPKMRHLVLYKLAGFCTAHIPPLNGELCLSKFRNFKKLFARKCQKWPFFRTFSPKKRIFRSFFDVFGEGVDPTFRENSQNRENATARGSGSEAPPRRFHAFFEKAFSCPRRRRKYRLTSGTKYEHIASVLWSDWACSQVGDLFPYILISLFHDFAGFIYPAQRGFLKTTKLK